MATSSAGRLLGDSEAALGLDFGNSNSKMTLAFHLPVRGVEIHRVLFHGGQDDPERSDSPTEFAAMAAWDGTQLLCGRRSLHHDVAIPLKSMMTYTAGIRRRSVLERLPGGANLVRAVEQGQVTVDSMRDALRRHFELLRAAALQQAETSGVWIGAIVLTYPNYLHAGEKDNDFDLYMDEYVALLRPIWGSYVLFEAVSEGQAAGLYICEKFEDPFGAASRKKRHDKIFQGLGVGGSGLNLVVVDVGTSTINLQGLSVYFKDGDTTEIVASESNVPHGWVTGAQGGSGLSNDAVRGVVETNLAPLEKHGQLRAGELAAILLDFEKQKRRLNYVTNTEALILRGNDPYRTFPLRPDTIRQAFRTAFEDGLQLLQRELQRVLHLGKDFTVLFCGGSFCNAGLYTEVQQMMTRIDDEARGRGITAKSTFLRDEHYWSATVSAGAALALMRMPAPADVMVGSAIGLQTLVKTPQQRWSGSRKAGFLFGRAPCSTTDGTRQRSMACESHVDVYVHPKKTNRIKFSLVCDPLYYHRADINTDDADTDETDDTDDADAEAGMAAPPAIRIGPSDRVIGGPLATYDLAWTLLPKAMPEGWVRIAATCTSFEELDEHQPIRLQVSCSKLRKQGVDRSHHRNRRWCLIVKTDPASKLLQVAEEMEWPIWCTRCRRDLVQAAWLCTTCKFNVCTGCHALLLPTADGSSSRHQHTWEEMDISG